MPKSQAMSNLHNDKLRDNAQLIIEDFHWLKQASAAAALSSSSRLHATTGEKSKTLSPQLPVKSRKCSSDQEKKKRIFGIAVKNRTTYTHVPARSQSIVETFPLKYFLWIFSIKVSIEKGLLNYVEQLGSVRSILPMTCYPHAICYLFSYNCIRNILSPLLHSSVIKIVKRFTNLKNIYIKCGENCNFF